MSGHQVEFKKKEEKKSWFIKRRPKSLVSINEMFKHELHCVSGTKAWL